MFLLFRGSAYCNGLQVGVLHGLHLDFLALSFSISCIPKDQTQGHYLSKSPKQGWKGGKLPVLHLPDNLSVGWVQEVNFISSDVLMAILQKQLCYIAMYI